MKVWWVNHYAVPPSQAGGTRHHTLAKYLAGASIEVTLMASSVNYLSRKENREGRRKAAEWEEVDGVGYLWIKALAYGEGPLARLGNMVIFALRLLVQRPWRHAEAPDAVIGSSPHPFAAWAGYRIAKKLGVPFIYEVRDLWPETLVQMGGYTKGNPVVRLFGRMQSQLLKKATAVITLLPGSEDYLRGHGASKGSVHWMPNVVDVAGVRCADPAGGGPGPMEVVYAGAHGVANALDTILDAADVLGKSGRGDAVRFTLIGDGPEKARLQARARRQDLRNVSFEEPVPKSRIHERLARADAFVLTLKACPLFRHGVSPNKLFDYMLCSRPVLFSVDAEVDPVKEAGAGLSVKPEDGQALAQAALRLLDMGPAGRLELGQAGRRYVVRHHDVAVVGERLRCLLAQVTSG